MSNEVPSRQAMFEKAWKGLKEQGWIRSYSSKERQCMYRAGDLRCAWGWVDPHNTEDVEEGDVYQLRVDKVGLAAHLSSEDIIFAGYLQDAHDCGYTPMEMEKNMRALATKHGLSIPDEEG